LTVCHSRSIAALIPYLDKGVLPTVEEIENELGDGR
jgi:hypothetical protein